MGRSGGYGFENGVERLDERAIAREDSLMSVDYKVILKKSDEGYAVGCPALPGCWSQGETEEEALENIRSAIREYLEARQGLLQDSNVRTVTVTV